MIQRKALLMGASLAAKMGDQTGRIQQYTQAAKNIESIINTFNNNNIIQKDSTRVWDAGVPLASLYGSTKLVLQLFPCFFCCLFPAFYFLFFGLKVMLLKT